MEIDFKTTSQAFEDDAWGETKRVLLDIVEKLDNHQDHGVIYDVNGNRIGDWSL